MHAGKPVILVIEATPSESTVLQALERMDARVHHARDSMQAIEIFESVDPDLLVLDLQAYAVNRVCFWDQVRTASVPPRKLLLVLSESQSLSDELVALEAGADEYLRKPVSEPRLLTRVGVLLRRMRRGPFGDVPSPFQHTT